jgi:hypothetical protein
MRAVCLENRILLCEKQACYMYRNVMRVTAGCESNTTRGAGRCRRTCRVTAAESSAGVWREDTSLVSMDCCVAGSVVAEEGASLVIKRVVHSWRYTFYIL